MANDSELEKVREILLTTRSEERTVEGINYIFPLV